MIRFCSDQFIYFRSDFRLTFRSACCWSHFLRGPHSIWHLCLRLRPVPLFCVCLWKFVGLQISSVELMPWSSNRSVPLPLSDVASPRTAAFVPWYFSALPPTLGSPAYRGCITCATALASLSSIPFSHLGRFPGRPRGSAIKGEVSLHYSSFYFISLF